ncbi:MAG TPA: sialidase family protein [Candidatus Thermoplasmatota archaeon]|nr:sialidase family protein [Candidatus Thermoplasmatota archaeon]
MRSVLLVVGLIMAGCMGSPTQTASVADLPDLLPGPISEVVTVLDEEGGTGEPSFGVAPDGTLFANGDGGRGGGVYRSTDRGATWERIATPVEPMINADPDLAVDKDGNVWFSALWIGCTSVAVSRDAGESFSFNPAVCNGPGSDRQYVIPTTGGTAYIYSHQLPTFWQMAAKTTDYGATWIPLGSTEGANFLLLNEGSGWGGGGFWNEAKDSVYFTFTWSQGGGLDAFNDVAPSAPGYTVSHDGGATWTVGTAKSMGGRGLGLGLVTGAADAAGNVYLVWGEEKDKDVAIYLASSTDDGATWNEPVRVDQGPGTGSKVFPTITAGPAGKVAVAYYQADVDAYPSDVGEDAMWNVTLAWTDDALAAAPTFEHGTLSAHPIKKGAICINGTTCQGDREFADYFQIHRLPDGRVGAIFNSLLDVKDTTVEVYAATKDAVLG